jgi:ABC-2 type transport system ATP-binding protein
MRRLDMPSVDVSHVSKTYADRPAVNDLSFSVFPKEIFGLIGPNGAGKTTTIRMMMDIIKPDSGEIKILGEKLGESTKNKLGYLPEERGMYKKQRVIDTILYLASLKGMSRQSAEEEADRLLQQTGMLPNKNKKIEELSKGMAQIIQFIITIIHNPQLVILDEGFSGLDPVNTEMLKGMVRELRNQGKTVIMSTHQMNQIEELCDRIMMMDHGRAVLYGDLKEIKSKFRSHSVWIDYEGDLGSIPGVTEKHTHKDYTELVLDVKTTPHEILELLVGQGIKINRFEIATPSLNEIFLEVAGKQNE